MNVAEETPSLDVFHRLAGQHFAHRTQGLDLQKLVVGESLERAAEIGVGLRRVGRRTFDKGFAVQKLRRPGVGIEHADLLRRRCCWDPGAASGAPW